MGQQYGINKQDLKLIGDFENYIYEYEKDNQHYILRLIHSSHRTENLVNGELDWIFYLHNNGANVCNPIFSNNNKLVERIEAKNSYFLATAFEKAPGEAPRRNNEALWNSSLFKVWGQTVGKMHALTRNYKPSNENFKRFELQEDDLYKMGVFPDTEKAAGIICKESKRLNNLVEELLTLSCIENKPYTSEMAKLNLSNMVKEYIQRVKGLALREKKEIITDIEDENVIVYADDKLLSQAIINVVSNCIRYANSAVIVKVFKSGSNAVIRIKDNGNGINEEDFPHIFERFYKGK